MTFQEIITSFPGGISFDQYLYDQGFSKQDLVSYINNYSKCTCCERHKENKPSSVEEYKDMEICHNRRDTNWSEEEKECDCDCRHLSRMSCKAIIEDSESIQEENCETDC
jgi:hypothetical protein